jgi:hypothetical protein
MFLAPVSGADAFIKGKPFVRNTFKYGKRQAGRHALAVSPNRKVNAISNSAEFAHDLKALITAPLRFRRNSPPVTGHSKLESRLRISLIGSAATLPKDFTEGSVTGTDLASPTSRSFIQPPSTDQLSHQPSVSFPGHG